MNDPQPAADTLIRNAVILTVDPQRRVFTNGFIAFTNGRISAIGPMSECQVTGADTIDAKGAIVMPGMVNAHNHLIQIAFRGYNDDRWPVLDIPAAVRALMGQLFTVAGRLDGERTRALVRLHALDLLKCGYTATHDEHFTNVLSDSVDGAWSALAESGLRGFVCRCIVDGPAIPAEGRETVERGLADVARLAARFGSERLQVATGFLNFNFRADFADMRAIRQGALALGVPFDVDMTDNSRGKTLAARGYGGGQVALYRDYGLLDDGPIYAGKGVHLAADDYAFLSRRDCRFALVPVLRFFDGTGVPAHEFLGQGMLPGLGSDAPLVSDSQNPFEIMRQLILAQNLWIKRAGEAPPPDLWLNAERVLEMATLGGARTLFIDDVAGSLEVGKAADCVIIDTAVPHLAPNHGGCRTPGALVWAGQGGDVTTVFVGGDKLIDRGRSTRWDEDAIVAEAEAVLAAIARETDLPAFLPPRVAGARYRGWTYI